MRRYCFLILFALVLVTPFVMRQVLVRDFDKGAGEGGDGLSLVIVTPHNQDIRRAFAGAFSDWHLARYGSRVGIVYRTPGGTNDIVRMLRGTYGTERMRTKDGALRPEEEVAEVVDIDLVWGGGDVTFEGELKPYLKPLKIDGELFKAAFPKPDLNGVALYEKTKDGAGPRWVGVVLSSFGIIYNPQLYETLELEAPKTWADLGRPELAGLVALADPTRSGSAAVTYMMAIQRAMADAEESLSPAERKDEAVYHAALARGWKEGMKTLVHVAANARYFTDSASQVPNDVGNGDAAAGVAIDFYARVYEQEIGSDRIRYVAPRGATAITPDPIGILYGVIGERELMANRFVEFLLTAEGQRLWNLKGGESPYLQRSLRRLPIRADVYADRRGWADDVNPFEESDGFNMRGAWMKLFSDIRPVWAAAWIDSRSALDEAYRAILEVKDVQKRDGFLEKLSDLPITMGDLEDQNKTRKRMEKDGKDARLWMTKQRIEQARRFREHYLQTMKLTQ